MMGDNPNLTCLTAAYIRNIFARRYLFLAKLFISILRESVFK